MDKQLIELCWKKYRDEIKVSWEDLALDYGYPTGEALRGLFKRYRYKNGEVSGMYEEGKVKILHVSDPHHPFNMPKEVFKDYVGKVDILVFNGDEQDCQSLSKFRKKYRFPFIEEMIGARQMIIDIIEYIKPKKVVLNYGNHNIRFINYFSDKIHEDLLQLMPETNLDFICDLGFWKHDHEHKLRTFYEPLTKVFEGKVDIEYTRNWYCRIGNTIFAHPKAYKQGILATTEKAYLYFLQLGQEHFDCLVLAHTHAQGFGRYGSTYLFESGAMCDEPTYAIDGGLNKPQSKGFLYLVQDMNGNLIYNESKIICL